MKLKRDLSMWLKNIKENKISYLYWGYLLIIGIIFYLMNCFTPLYSDDWHYCFVFGTTEPIKSLSDILKSLYIHYFEMNGRFIPHFFVQFFDGIAGKTWFDIANAIMFIFLLLLLCKTISNNTKQYYKIVTLSSLGIFFFMPGFNYNFLWMSGACNYLWSTVLLLSFNLLLQKDIKNKYLYPLLFLYGVMSGWTHEGIVLGLASGYFIYYLLNQKEFKPTSRKILLSGFFIGMFLLIFSPGSISRFLEGKSDSFSFTMLIHNILSSLLNMDNIILLPLLIIIIGIFYFTKRLQLKEYIKTNSILFIAIIINFLFVLLTKHTSIQSRFGFEFLCLILIIKTIHQLNIPQILLYTTNTIIILFLSLVILPVSANNSHEFNHIKSQIEKNEKKGIILTSNIDDIIPFHLRRYFIHYISVVGLEYDTPFKGSEFINNYFNKDNLIFIPEEFYTDLQLHPEHYNNFYTTPKRSFYAKRLEKHETNIHYITYQLRTATREDIPFHHLPIAHMLERYTTKSIFVDPKYYSIVTINQIPFLLVGKNKLIDNRVEQIIYE